MRCTICSNERAEAINDGLLRQVPFRSLAQRFGTSISALSRHRKKCLPKLLSTGATALEIDLGERALDRLEKIAQEPLQVMAWAKAARDGNLVLKAVREARNNEELRAKLTGEWDGPEQEDNHRPMFILEGDAQVTVNISPPERDEKPEASLSSERVIEAEATEVDGSEEESNAVQ